jgi:hypothetical protein
MGKTLERESLESQFFDSIFGDTLEENSELKMVIWSKPPGRVAKNTSRFFGNLVAAGDYSKRIKEKQEVYFSMGLFHERIAEHRFKRGRQDDVLGICGFAADFDYQGDKRSKGNLFPDRESVFEFFTTLRNAPTYVVASGNGVHAYWLFQEPWIFDGKEEREAAKRMSIGWGRHLKDRTQFEIDNTSTLERVWRVPGTLNHKYKPPGLVEIIHANDWGRFDPDEDFSMFSVSKDLATGLPGGGERITVAIDPSVPIPERALRAIAADEDFSKTWHHGKRIADTSQSGWDFAIGNYGRQMGWSIDEVLNAIICNRRQHSGNLMESNPGYYSTTLTKLFGTEVDQKATRHNTALDTFARTVGLPITEISMFGQATDLKKITYYIKLSNGTDVRIGRITDFRNRMTWRNLKAIINPHGDDEAQGQKAWNKLVDTVMAYVKDRSTVDDDADLRFLIDLDTYFASVGTPDLSGKTHRECSYVTMNGAPFEQDDYLFFQSDRFIKWAKDKGRALDTGDFKQRLRKAECDRSTRLVERKDGSTTSRSYWFIRRDKLNEQITKLLEEGVSVLDMDKVQEGEA